MQNIFGALRPEFRVGSAPSLLHAAHTKIWAIYMKTAAQDSVRRSNKTGNTAGKVGLGLHLCRRGIVTYTLGWVPRRILDIVRDIQVTAFHRTELKSRKSPITSPAPTSLRSLPINLAWAMNPSTPRGKKTLVGMEFQQRSKFFGEYASCITRNSACCRAIIQRRGF